MRNTILLVGHGSRAAGGNEEIHQFATHWREQNPHWRIEVCFIEFADVLLPDGMAAAARDSDRVVVVPLILNAAGHVKMDIPQAIDAAREAHPDVAFLYTPHLSACEPLLKMLRRLLRQTMLEIQMPDPHTTGVILLGRGSSDRQANGEVAKMARWLWEVTDHELVDIAFTGVTYPRLEKVVQRQVKLGMTQIVVVPYYLFTGTLMTRIYQQVSLLQQQYPQIRFAHTDYFGFEKEVYEVASLRVKQALDSHADSADAAHSESPVPEGQQSTSGLLNCDGCKIRDLAVEMGHGGHHHHGHDHSHEHAHDHSHEHNHEHHHHS